MNTEFNRTEYEHEQMNLVTCGKRSRFRFVSSDLLTDGIDIQRVRNTRFQATPAENVKHRVLRIRCWFPNRAMFRRQFEHSENTMGY